MHDKESLHPSQDPDHDPGHDPDMTLDLLVLNALLERRVDHAVALLRPWLFDHGVRGARSLLAQCPPWGRERLALLLTDMLETWPHRLLASPALIQARPSPCSALCELGGDTPMPCPAEQRMFRLKGPEHVCGLENAGPGLRFLGWVRSGTAPSLVRDQLSRRAGLSVPWERPVSVLAVFEVTDWDAQEDSGFLQTWYKAVGGGRAQPTAWPRSGSQDKDAAYRLMPDSPVPVATGSLSGNLPGQWWAPFFECCQGKVHAAPLMGYARAVEYALIMAAAAQTRANRPAARPRRSGRCQGTGCRFRTRVRDRTMATALRP